MIESPRPAERLPNLPLTMQAIAAYTFEDIRLETRPVPEPGAGEALIRVTASGLCTGDMTPWYINQKAAKSGGSVVLGHEAVGEIVALGPNAPASFNLGDRIVPHHHAPCMQPSCPACRRGAYVQCPAWKATGFIPGGMADYMVVDANCLRHDTQHIPATVSNAAAALTEPTACCVKAVTKRAHLVPNGTLVLIGLGVMGMLNLRVARAVHRGRIVAIDRIPWRLDQAARRGADVTIDASSVDAVQAVRDLTDGMGAESVICGPGIIPVMQQALEMVAPQGTVCYFMTVDRHTEMSIRPFDWYFRELTVTHAYSAGPDDMQHALTLIEQGAVSPDDVVTEWVALPELPAAYRRAASPGEHLKTMVTWA